MLRYSTGITFMAASGRWRVASSLITNARWGPQQESGNGERRALYLQKEARYLPHLRDDGFRLECVLCKKVALLAANLAISSSICCLVVEHCTTQSQVIVLLLSRSNNLHSSN